MQINLDNCYKFTRVHIYIYMYIHISCIIAAYTYVIAMRYVIDHSLLVMFYLEDIIDNLISTFYTQCKC